MAAGQAHTGSPRDLFSVCCERLSLPHQGTQHSHTKRRFLFVDTGNISRDRPSRTQTKTLKNTRKMHCIRGIQPFVVCVRERSCFCNGCRGDDACAYTGVSGQWTVRADATKETAKSPGTAAHSARRTCPARTCGSQEKTKPPTVSHPARPS